MPPNQPHQDSVVKDDTPIIFSSPGLTPDVRFKVFKQEYHVHSIILKLYSNYFRSLEPASKVTSLHFTLPRLIPHQGPQLTNDHLCMVPSLQDQESAFHMLLSAMYNRPYFITKVEHLRHLASLSDFYCALPIVSATLTGALFNSPIFRPDPLVRNLCLFAQSRQTILLWAKKLRHPLLFREAFIHVVAGWHAVSMRCQAIRDDARLASLISSAHSQLQTALLKAHQALLLAMLQPKPAIRSE